MNEPFNDFKAAFRNYVLTGGSVSTLIGTRFYGSQLATLRDPIFPLGVFWSNEGVERVYLQDFILNVRGCSDNHYDEAHDVLNAIRDRIKNVTISNRINVTARGTPVELYETEPRIYSVVGKFRVQRILSK